MNGVRSAQRQLYDKYRSHWYLICMRYTRHEHDANDALQNALVKIYQNLGGFDADRGSFKAWSSRIVVNECLMFLRKRNGNRAFSDSLEGANEASYESVAVTRLTEQEIYSVISRLPDGYRAVFNLYAIEGYAHEEIAAKLQISVGTSKSQLHKAKKALQNSIEQFFEISHP